MEQTIRALQSFEGIGQLPRLTGLYEGSATSATTPSCLIEMAEKDPVRVNDRTLKNDKQYEAKHGDGPVQPALYFPAIDHFGFRLHDFTP